MIDTNSRVGQYVGVNSVHDTHIGSTKIKIILYGGLNAYGLIGTEYNGIAVLDETNKRVICDEIAHEDSGYFGPSRAQLKRFGEMAAMTEKELVDFINQQPKRRFDIPADWLGG